MTGQGKTGKRSHTVLLVCPACGLEVTEWDTGVAIVICALASRYLSDSKWKNIPDMKTYLYEKDDAGYNFPWIDEEYYFDKSESWIIRKDGLFCFNVIYDILLNE